MKERDLKEKIKERTKTAKEEKQKKREKIKEQTRERARKHRERKRQEQSEQLFTEPSNPGFRNRTSKKRATDKVKGQLPGTSCKKADIVQSIVSSPRTRKKLSDRGEHLKTKKK